jgi:hypothetical protein
MASERVVGSYLIRFVQQQTQQRICLHNLKTGERLEFETWVAAWLFIEQQLEDPLLENPKLLRD